MVLGNQQLPNYKEMGEKVGKEFRAQRLATDAKISSAINELRMEFRQEIITVRAEIEALKTKQNIIGEIT
jgi:hypothetical protein